MLYTDATTREVYIERWQSEIPEGRCNRCHRRYGLYEVVSSAPLRISRSSWVGLGHCKKEPSSSFLRCPSKHLRRRHVQSPKSLSSPSRSSVVLQPGQSSVSATHASRLSRSNPDASSTIPEAPR